MGILRIVGPCKDLGPRGCGASGFQVLEILFFWAWNLLGFSVRAEGQGEFLGPAAADIHWGKL